MADHIERLGTRNQRNAARVVYLLVLIPLALLFLYFFSAGLRVLF